MPALRMRTSAHQAGMDLKTYRCLFPLYRMRIGGNARADDRRLSPSTVLRNENALAVFASIFHVAKTIDLASTADRDGRTAAELMRQDVPSPKHHERTE